MIPFVRSVALIAVLGCAVPASGRAQASTPASDQSAPLSEPKAPAAGARAQPGVSRSAATAHRQAAAPRKVVVREGGASEPTAQMAPDLNPAEAARQRQAAAQWLQTTDDDLRLLASRPLNAQQIETVGQIRNYMAIARAALQEGDVRRSTTLAEKAHLLSDDLLKH